MQLKYQIVADHINSLCHDVRGPHQVPAQAEKFDETKAVRNKKIALMKVGIVCPGNILSGRPRRHVTLPSKAHNVESKEQQTWQGRVHLALLVLQQRAFHIQRPEAS